MYNLKIKKKEKTNSNKNNPNFHPNWEQAVQEANKTASSMLSGQGNQQQRSKCCPSIRMLTMFLSLSAQKDHSSNLGETHPISSSLLAGCNRKPSYLSALLPLQCMSLHSIKARTVLIYQQIRNRIKMQLLFLLSHFFPSFLYFFNLHDKMKIFAA